MGLLGRVSARAIEAIGHDILRGLKWQYFLNIGIGIFGAAYIVFAGRLLGPETFGVYALCLAIPTFVGALFDCRLQEVAIYLSANSKGDQFRSSAASLMLTDVGMKLASAAVSLMVAYLCILMDYGGLDWTFVALATATLLVSKALNSPAMGLLRLSGHLQVFSLLQVADWACRLALLGALAVLGKATISNIFLSQIVVGGLFNGLVVRRGLATVNLKLPNILRSAQTINEFLVRHAKVIFGSQSISAMDSVVKELDVVICGIFLSASQVGIYKMTKSLAGVAWRLADPVYIVVLPKLAHLHAQKNMGKLAEVTLQLTIGLAIGGLGLLFTSALGVWLFAPFFLGADYATSINLFPVAALWITVALPFIWTHSLSIGTGRPDIQVKAGLTGNGIGLLAIIWGAAWYGLIGALAGLSVAYCLPFVISFFLLRHNGIVRW